MSYDVRLKMLSQETLNLLEALAATSRDAYGQGGLILSFTSANGHMGVYAHDESGRRISRASGKHFQPTLDDQDLRALATLIKFARGDGPGQDPTPADHEAAIRLIALLQRDLHATAVAYRYDADFDESGLSGDIVLIDESYSFSLHLFWSVD